MKKDEGSSGDWKIEWRKEVKKENNKTIDASNFDKYFPRPNWYSQEGQFHKVWKSNWNFIEGAGELKNICGSAEADCPVLTQSKIQSWHAKYEWSGSSWYDGWCNYLHYGKYCDSVYEWTDNYDPDEGIPWWNYMYRSEDDGSKNYDLRD